MGFLSSQGSLDQTSSRTDDIKLRPELVDKRPVVDNQAVNGEVAIRDTFLANTATNTDTFKSEYSLVAGYPEGSIVYVTWYTQHNALTNIRSINVERLTADSDLTHRSYVQIRNFELRLKENFNFNFDTDKNISSVTGSAIGLPGFEPLVNDIFLYKLRNDKIGVFTVTNVDRLALGNDTYCAINFILTSYLTPSYREQLTKQTTAVFYFDKTKFLAGNHAFLTSDNYSLKKDLIQIRKELIRDYHDRFYTYELNSFVRPDKVYDPYVITYWNKKISLDDLNYRPLQLLISEQAYRNTIWSILTDNPIRNLNTIDREYQICDKWYSTWDTNLNALSGRKVLIIGKDIKFERGAAWQRKFLDDPYGPHAFFPAGDRYLINRLRKEHEYWYGKKKPEHTPDHDKHPDPDCEVCHHKYHHHEHHHKYKFFKSYALSEEFYMGSTSMSTLEQLLYDLISNKVVDPNKILTTIDSYAEWDDESAFYNYLVAIHLIDYGVHWLTNHS